MNSIPFIHGFAAFSLLMASSPLLRASSDTLEKTFSEICRQGDNQVLVEARNVPAWKSIIEQNGWTCDQNTADDPSGTLKFSCEPQSDSDTTLGLITVTWLEGEDEKQQLAQWMHQFATEQAMFCSLAKTEIWDQFDQ
jgi:hypothetical protein